MITDPREAEMLFDLGRAAASAVEGGLISSRRATAWSRGVAAGAARGRFLAALTAFMAWGRVPRVGRMRP